MTFDSLYMSVLLSLSAIVSRSVHLVIAYEKSLEKNSLKSDNQSRIRGRDIGFFLRSKRRKILLVKNTDFYDRYHMAQFIYHMEMPVSV